MDLKEALHIAWWHQFEAGFAKFESGDMDGFKAESAKARAIEALAQEYGIDLLNKGDAE